VAEFARLGIDRVTLSGGDPLAIDGIVPFLRRLRRDSVRSIKLDTVGTPLIPGAARQAFIPVANVLCELDVLGLPMDGWSNESVNAFRLGRPSLFDETSALLDSLNGNTRGCRVYINTVLHRRNVRDAVRIYEAVARHPVVSHWNVFEYTPTDQVSEAVNRSYRLERGQFERARAVVLDVARKGGMNLEIEFASVFDRIGKYLLINSDGEAWIPDEAGRTVGLGCVFGREQAVLAGWLEATSGLVSRCC
jgi:MoaA/NifB/PqqE/SkfB family radical SAM enzyme